MKFFLILACAAWINLHVVPCDHYFPGDDDISVKGWWLMRMDMIMFGYLVGAIALRMPTPKGYEHRITQSLAFWVSLSTTDVLERAFHDRGPFTIWDAAGIIMAFVYCIYEARINNFLKKLLRKIY